jgi:membrane protein YqaA with SNARE-associated domain
VGPLGWAEIAALLTSVGFGVLSAVFPLANAETYVIASQVSAVAGVIPIAVGVGIGQTIGKIALFLGVRSGRHSRFAHRQRSRRLAQPVGPTRERLRQMMHQLLVLVGTKRWGLPIVFLAAVVGLPPLYAVALLAGATKMRLLWFALVVLVGRLARFVLVALGGQGLHF